MSLRYTILSYLAVAPATGYELARRLDGVSGAPWEAQASQIYPELRELEQAGWIDGNVAAADRLKRRVYRLTRPGEAALAQWVATANDYPPERDAERVRLMLLARASPETIRRHFEEHRAHFAARLELWRRLFAEETEAWRQGLPSWPAGTADERARAQGLRELALTGNMRRAENEIAWAEAALQWLESQSGIA